MSMQEVIDYLLKEPIIDAKVTKATLISIGIAELCVPVFMMVAFGWELFVTTIKSIDEKPKLFRKEELARLVAIMIIIGPLYFAVMGATTGLIDSINKATIPTDKMVAAGLKEFENLLAKQVEDKKGEGSNATPKEGDPKIEVPPTTEEKVVGKINLFLLLTDGMTAATFVIVAVIRLVVQCIATMLAKFLFVIGPLVFVASIFRSNMDKVVVWFWAYVNTLLVTSTLNLLEFLIYAPVGDVLEGKSLVNPFANFVFNLSVIIVNCLAFWLTSFIAGMSAGGKVLSTAVAVGTQIAAASMGAPGAGGGASGGAIENVVNTTPKN